MATILFNNIENNTKIYNQLYNPYIFQTFIIKEKNKFRIENYETKPMTQKYNYRPDIVSYEVYGDEFFYPIILLSNNLGSIIQFTVDKIGNTLFYLKPEILDEILQKL